MSLFVANALEREREKKRMSRTFRLRKDGFAQYLPAMIFFWFKDNQI